MIGYCAIVAALLICAPPWWSGGDVTALDVAAAHAPAGAAPAAPGRVWFRPAVSGPPAGNASLDGGRKSAVDPWVGEDKVRHFSLSFALVAFGNAAGVGIGMDERNAVAGAVLAAAAAGVLKEVHDHARGGIFSIRDIAWNSAGIAVAVAVIGATR